MFITDVLKKLPQPAMVPLKSPAYTPGEGTLRIGLAVESMKRHMTDEGWQIFAGLEQAGYLLGGHHLPLDTVDVRRFLVMNPGTIVLQDKREWDVTHSRDFRDPAAKFQNVGELKSREDVFKLTILKDSHQAPEYHRESAEEIGCHAWIGYYHPTIVQHLAPYVRKEHYIRTYHTLDPFLVPAYKADRTKNVLISGAVSSAYPLRQQIIRNLRHFRALGIDYLQHPGYHRNGSCTEEFLQALSQYKVSICTASKYGYLLRKIVESTACGCRVITDLPEDEVVPEISENLIRVSPRASMREIHHAIEQALTEYDTDSQEFFARQACERFDFRRETSRLASEIEVLRENYATTIRSK